MFYNLKDKKLKNSNRFLSHSTRLEAILEKNSNIWFNSVLREDIENINISEEDLRKKTKSSLIIL